MSKHERSDEITSHGTVKGHHPRPEDNVPEGGPAPAPTEGQGAAKGAASKAVDGAVAGDNTSTATAGKAEKEHAAGVAAEKTQSGRGHRKHED